MDFLALNRKFFDDNCNNIIDRNVFVEKSTNILNELRGSFDDVIAFDKALDEAFKVLFKKYFYANKEFTTNDKFITPLLKGQQYYIKCKEDFGNGLEEVIFVADKRDTYLHGIILYQYAEAGLFGKINLYDNSILKVEDIKASLISEITEFFKTTARIMLIKNGKEQPIIADLEFRQNINSAIDQAKTKGLYTHCVTDRSGQFLLLNGQTIDIKISETGLDKISQIINTRAGYCYKAIGYHTAIIKAIQSLEVLENYKAKNCYLLEGEEVWKVCNGRDYEIPNIIKVNDDGEVVSW